MPYRDLTAREANALRGMDRPLLPVYIRMLSGGGVRYREIAAVLGCAESTVADLAAQGRPPVSGQRVPAGFAGYLRQLRAEADPELNSTLALAVGRGWTYAALAEALGVSPAATRSRAIRGARVLAGDRRQARGSRDRYVPDPGRQTVVKD